jgi:hypothetical protein
VQESYLGILIQYSEAIDPSAGPRRVDLRASAGKASRAGQFWDL